MRFRATMPLALGVLIAACAPEAEQPYESPAAAVVALVANYEDRYNQGHASEVADMYTEDAIVQGSASAGSAGREALFNRKNIARYTQGFMTALSPKLSISPAEQMTVGDWVLDRGSYTNEVMPGDGEAITLTGNYISLWRQTPEGLRIHRQTVNFDGPPPPLIPAMDTMVFVPRTDGELAGFLASYAEHYNMGNASLVAEHWAEDGVAMFSELPQRNGRQEIEAAIADLMEQMPPMLTIKNTETLMIGEGVAVDRGSFKMEGTMGGQSVTRNGTYMGVVRQADDGTWTLQWGISNLSPFASM